jgi:hypothetical protein
MFTSSTNFAFRWATTAEQQALGFSDFEERIFPHIAVRTLILPKRDLNYRSRLAGYEFDDQTLES